MCMCMCVHVIITLTVHYASVVISVVNLECVCTCACAHTIASCVYVCAYDNYTYRPCASILCKPRAVCVHVCTYACVYVCILYINSILYVCVCMV